MKLLPTIAGFAVGAAVCAGCGGSSNSASTSVAAAASTATTGAPPPGAASTAATATTAPATTSTTAAVNYGAEYLAIVTPVNAALSTFSAAAKNLPGNASSAQAQTVVDPAVTAIQTFRSQLLAVTWPGKAAADVQALTADAATVQADLTGLLSATTVTETSLDQQFAQDASKTQAASALVRTDLGLPQTS